MNTSLSAIGSWRECQQKYWYRYVEGLKPKLERPAPLLGSILHRLLERFYLFIPGDPDDALRQAIEFTCGEFQPKIDGLVFAAQTAGEDQLGLDLQDLLPRALRIFERYFLVRGRPDFEQLWPVLVEYRYTLELDRGLQLVGIADLVAEQDGQRLLWEHKTTGSVPGQGRRLRDLQTTLMSAALEELGHGPINGVVWNYIRTKEPTVPALLKNGMLTTRADLDSTWAVYQAEIQKHGLREEDYLPVKERLEGREEAVFFPRVVLPLMQAEHILLRDFIATARTVQAIRESGGNYIPVRSVGFGCDFCEYNKLCEAVILGGDEEEVVQRLFVRKESKEVASDNGDTSSP